MGGKKRPRLAQWESALRDQAQRCRDAAMELDRQANWVRQKDFRYRVELQSLWAPEGEVDADANGKKGESLRKVELKAEEEFKELNNRSDVQAKRFYFLLFPDDSTWPLRDIT